MSKLLFVEEVRLCQQHKGIVHSDGLAEEVHTGVLHGAYGVLLGHVECLQNVAGVYDYFVRVDEAEDVGEGNGIDVVQVNL